MSRLSKAPASRAHSNRWREFEWAPSLAKRLKCAELAPAFVCLNPSVAPPEGGNSNVTDMKLRKTASESNRTEAVNFGL